MNRPLPSFRAGRRQFFREGFRFAILGGLATIAARLITRPRLAASNQVCIKAGICSGCEAFEDCGLPRALSVKAASSKKL